MPVSPAHRATRDKVADRILTANTMKDVECAFHLLRAWLNLFGYDEILLDSGESLYRTAESLGFLDYRPPADDALCHAPQTGALPVLSPAEESHRIELVSQIFNAATVEEVYAARRALRTWLLRYPTDQRTARAGEILDLTSAALGLPPDQTTRYRPPNRAQSARRTET